MQKNKRDEKRKRGSARSIVLATIFLLMALGLGIAAFMFVGYTDDFSAQATAVQATQDYYLCAATHVYVYTDRDSSERLAGALQTAGIAHSDVLVQAIEDGCLGGANGRLGGRTLRDWGVSVTLPIDAELHSDEVALGAYIREVLAALNTARLPVLDAMLVLRLTTAGQPDRIWRIDYQTAFALLDEGTTSQALYAAGQDPANR